MNIHSPNLYKKYLTRLMSLVAVGILCTNCSQQPPQKKLRNPTFTQDSIRLKEAIDSVFDIQFDYPDSAFAGWQPLAEEALEKKIYRPLMSYYKYGVFNRAVLAQDVETATDLANQSMVIAKLTNDSTFLGQANYNIGLLFGAQGVLDSASYYFLQAVDLLQGGQDWGTELDAWNNLAEMTKMQNDLLTAEKYKLSVLRRTKKRKDKTELGYMYASLSELYIELDKMDQSKIYLDSATQVYQALKDPFNLYLLNAKVNLATTTAQFDSSLYYLHLLYDKSKKGENGVTPSNVLFKLANVHHQLNQQDSAKYYLSLFENRKALDQLSMDLQLQYYQMKYAFSEVRTPPEDKVELLTNINDLLNKKLEQNQNLFGTQRLHQIEQAEKDNIILQKTVQNQRKNLTITWLIIGLAFLLGGILFAFFYFKKRRELQVQKFLLLEQERAFELKSARLQSQLIERNRISQELHDDLGTTLTSISMSTELLKRKHPALNSREVEIISDSSSSLVDKMNEIVWSLNSNNDSLQSLVAYIRKFASKFLTEAGIPFSVQLPPLIPNIELAGDVRRSIFLTAKEALNNVVKHAAATQIQLRFNIEQDLFTIQMKDNGQGFVVENDAFTNGNGLRNMKNNMENIDGKMTYISSPEGSIISISFPLNKSEYER